LIGLMSWPPTLVFSDRDEALRADIRRWIQDNDPGRPSEDLAERVKQLAQWQAALHAAGFIGLSWSPREGGRGMGISAEAVLAEELGRSSMPELINRIALYTVAPAMMMCGTPELRREFFPGMLDASEIWCQGFSEPDAGSDLAGVRTRAAFDGSDYVINGQKVWTSRGLWARWCALLARTSGQPGDHRGLTLFVVDMEAAGVTVRPLHQILHEPHFSEVFLDDVRVPPHHVIGDVDRGWTAAMSTMGYERGLFVLERQIGLTKRLNDLVLRHRDELDAVAIERIGALFAQLEVLRAHTYRTLAEQERGELARGATSVDKLLLTECYQHLCAEAFDLFGEQDALAFDDRAHDLLESRSVSIYSGTTEIQRNIIATQLLGLPKGAG
jgi:alkylation response protein AidB-like acyl-CoA dehydrogenase